MADAIFECRGISKYYTVRKGLFQRGAEFKALDGVTLTLKRGTVYGVVGESGSGKTTLARMLAGLIRPDTGRIDFEGRPLPGVLASAARVFRGKVQMVFQNPYLSLDPKWKVETILQEGLADFPRRERRERIYEAIKHVGLKTDYLKRRPGALSGGERQRVAIARALAVKPEFLILDEPTSALDVSIQSRIIELLCGLKAFFRGGMMFITHDIAVVSRLAERIMVFHRGKLVEEGLREEVIRSPRQEYTKRLIESVPKVP